MFAQQQAAEALNNALFAYSARRIAEIRPSDRLVHYTSQETAAKIIQGETGRRTIWLRNAREMNDFSEVSWGQHCLSFVFGDWRLVGRFRSVLNSIHPKLFESLASALISEQPHLGDLAYLTSLSLHNADECTTGKLSMWRAYGAPHSICIVFNTRPFMGHQTAYEVVLSPVMYGGRREFSSEFEGILFRLERSVALLRAMPPELLFADLKRALDFAVLSTKHAGFHEEVEWRLIHQHSEFRPDPPSHRRIINGVEQTIYELPLENRPDKELWGAELGEILDRIIIGPTDDPKSAIERFVELLRSAGVSVPEERVFPCGIPFRTNIRRA